PPPPPSSVVYPSGRHPDLPSFPTRRSSDLVEGAVGEHQQQLPFAARQRQLVLDLVPDQVEAGQAPVLLRAGEVHPVVVVPEQGGDRKSTRLNSSHVKISYAVFCLKKKNKEA